MASADKSKKLSKRSRSSGGSADFGSPCVLTEPGGRARSDDEGAFVGEAVREDRSGNPLDTSFDIGDSLIVGCLLEGFRRGDDCLGGSVRLMMLSSSSSSESGMTDRCQGVASLLFALRDVGSRRGGACRATVE